MDQRRDSPVDRAVFCVFIRGICINSNMRAGLGERNSSNEDTTVSTSKRCPAAPSPANPGPYSA